MDRDYPQMTFDLSSSFSTKQHGCRKNFCLEVPKNFWLDMLSGSKLNWGQRSSGDNLDPWEPQSQDFLDPFRYVFGMITNMYFVNTSTVGIELLLEKIRFYFRKFVILGKIVIKKREFLCHSWSSEHVTCHHCILLCFFSAHICDIPGICPSGYVCIPDTAWSGNCVGR